LGYVIERVITEVQRFGEYMKDNRRSRRAYLCTLGVLAHVFVGQIFVIIFAKFY
jgi:hypothetical protein